MFGCFRTGDANDPETYVAAITAVLAHYQEDIITRVTHPVTGLPSKVGWLPTVKEVHDACEEAAAPAVRRQQRDRQVAELMAEREAIEAQRGQVRPTLDEMKAKYGPDWGLDLDPGKAYLPAEASVARPTIITGKHHSGKTETRDRLRQG